ALGRDPGRGDSRTVEERQADVRRLVPSLCHECRLGEGGRMTRISQVRKAGWPLLLCAASAGGTFAWVRMSDSNREKHMGKVTIEHVHVETEKPFAEVAAALEARMGKFDPSVYDQLRNGADPEAVRKRLEQMAGPSGFMLFRTSDHGALLRLASQTKKAAQYHLGNPLFAVRMTQHDIRAGLYAPLRVLVYEDGGGTTCIEYDRPSSLFGQFGNPKVTEVATMLDRKLEQLVAEAIQQ